MKFSLNSFKNKSSSNTDMSLPSQTEEDFPQAPPSRKLSEKLSFSTSELGTQLKNRRKSSHHQMDLDFLKIPPKALEALKPLTALLASQEIKRYFYWEFNPSVEDRWTVITTDSTESVASVEIKGTSFVIETQETSRVLDVDLTGGVTLRVETDGAEYQLMFNDGEVTLSTKSEHSINVLYRTALLSIFERFSILKALTGALIAQIGLRMSDINLVLNSHFSFKDWCDVYLEEQGGWVRLWCHVDGVEKKNKQAPQTNGTEKKKSSLFGKNNSNGESQPKPSKKGGYKIKFYKDNKSTNSKNMVCFISSENNDIQDLFFYGTNENNPLGQNDGGESFLDNNLNMIKVIGEVSFSNNINSPNPEQGSFSKSGSSGFLNGQLRNLSKSSRNLSVSSGNSSNDDNQLTSPKSRGGFFSSPKLGGPGSPIVGHKRSTSIASKKSSKSIPQNFTNVQRSLLIRPVEHEGVKQLETLIRFIVPLMDCLGKYGRPSHFNTNKNDPSSLMFGLPRLPIIDYFARKETKELLQTGPTDKSLQLEGDTATVAMKWLTRALQDYTRKLPDRDTKLAFTKITDIYPTVTTQSRNASRSQTNLDDEIQLQVPSQQQQQQKAPNPQQYSNNPYDDGLIDTYNETSFVQDQMQAEAEELQAGMDMGFDMDMAMITDSIRNTNVEEYR